jgi:hypothetical protein
MARPNNPSADPRVGTGADKDEPVSENNSVNDIVSGEDPPVFYPEGKQHRLLGIPMEGLPTLSDAEFDDLLSFLWRYEETLGIAGPGDSNAAESTEVLVQIISDRCAVSLNEARELLSRTVEKHRSGRGLEDGNHGEYTVIWEPEDALAFVMRLSGASPSVVATFLYIHQCDELAEGLHVLEDQEGWIRRTYKWALSFTQAPTPQAPCPTITIGDGKFVICDGQHRSYALRYALESTKKAAS